MAHQLALMAKALKRDMEEALTQNNAKNAGNATTARQTGGLETWITTNKSIGTNGVYGGSGAATTNGTQRAITESLLLRLSNSLVSLMVVSLHY